MKEFYSLTELDAASLPDLPAGFRSLERYAQKNWRSDPVRYRKAEGRKGGGGFEYHISLLPKAAQTRLIVLHDAPANDDRDANAARKKALWSRFEALSNEQKAACRLRLNALLFATDLIANGLTATAAMKVAARKFDVSAATLYNWQELTHGVDRDDWLAALAPSFAATAKRADCHADAWEFLKSDYLRPEKPTFTACYDRLLKAAKVENWSPVPSERALRRRFDAEVSQAVRVLARNGKDKAKALFPAQRRTRDHLHAMQAVNMDGHKIDVFVKVPWSDAPVRMFLVAIQDLYSGKVVAYRLADAETKETVRLVIGDMVERFGIPDDMYLDNGRAFASKWISGGSKTRFRFKVRDEDPQGLLTTLGVNIHWTTPYSGQSKPIERAFRDLADHIAKHPFCSGAYTGNRPDAKPENYMSRAVPLADFQAHVIRQIEDHNARVGRRSKVCDGRSFDEAFRESMEAPATIVRWPSPAQRALWLLASEVLTTKKGSGEVHYQGNRYWSRELNQHAGRKVTIRFDPDALHSSVKVYDLNDVLICEAPCIADTGFNDAEAARLHARTRREFQKGLDAQRKAEAALSAQQLADILSRGAKTAAQEPEPIRPAVPRLITGNTALKPTPAPAIDQDDFEDKFGRALRLVSGNASVLPFPPKGNTADP